MGTNRRRGKCADPGADSPRIAPIAADFAAGGEREPPKRLFVLAITRCGRRISTLRTPATGGT
jgi:hypothetical protein